MTLCLTLKSAPGPQDFLSVSRDQYLRRNPLDEVRKFPEIGAIHVYVIRASLARSFKKMMRIFQKSESMGIGAYLLGTPESRIILDRLNGTKSAFPT